MDSYLLPSITVLLLFVSTIAWAGTTASTAGVLTVLRTIATGAIIAALSASLLLAGLLRKRIVVGVALWSLLFTYAGLNAVARGSELHSLGEMALNFGLTTLLIYSFTFRPGSVFNLPSLWAWVGIAGAVFIFSIAMGGIVLSIPPRFVLEVLSPTTGALNLNNYSQGISKFYGLAAVVSVYLLNSATHWRFKSILVVAIVVFLALAFLGGGRGDFIAALAVSTIFLFAKGSRVVVGIVLLIIAYAALEYLDVGRALRDIPVLSRYEYLGRSAGMRDVLAVQAMVLLEQNPSCLIVGCGFNFFQEFYGYPHGLYPHNLILESIIVFGLPLTLALTIMAGLGLYRLKRGKDGNDAFVMIFLFFVLVGLKSGELLTSWFVCAGFIFLITTVVYPGRRPTMHPPSTKSNASRKGRMLRSAERAD